jgi:ABC-type transport system substrate-binding protein
MNWQATVLFIIVFSITAGAIIFIGTILEENKKLAETSKNTPTTIIPSDTYPVNYDPTAGWVKTHVGTGKYVEYNGNTQRVTVEMDYGYLVELDGKGCFIDERV